MCIAKTIRSLLYILFNVTGHVECVVVLYMPWVKGLVWAGLRRRIVFL